MSRGS